MKTIIQCITTLLCCIFFSANASASHYLLEDVSFVSEAERTSLNKAKVEATEELLQKAATKKGRQSLAKATGLSLERIRELVTLTDLLQIRGIGPKMALLFQASNVKTAADLSKEDIAALYPRMKEVNRSKMISEVLPSQDLVASWVKAAGSVPVKLDL